MRLRALQRMHASELDEANRAAERYLSTLPATRTTEELIEDLGLPLKPRALAARLGKNPSLRSLPKHAKHAKVWYHANFHLFLQHEHTNTQTAGASGA